MKWFRRKPTQAEYVQAAVTVGSNLYLHTIASYEKGANALKFDLPDSRYRYLVFCLCATVTSALVYDESKELAPDILIKGCLHFAKWTATANAREYFKDPIHFSDFIEHAATYFQEYLRDWSRWPQFEKDGKHGETLDLICHMIHTAESAVPTDTNDVLRINKLATEIACRITAMRGAFVELAYK